MNGWHCPYCPTLLASPGMVDAHIIQAHPEQERLIAPPTADEHPLDALWDGTPSTARAIANAKARERLAALPSDDEREALGEAALRAYLAPTEPRPWSRLSKSEREKWIAAGSVGFRRQGPITDEAVKVAHKAWDEFPDYDPNGDLDAWEHEEARVRAALEAARDES